MSDKFPAEAFRKSFPDEYPFCPKCETVINAGRKTDYNLGDGQSTEIECETCGTKLKVTASIVIEYVLEIVYTGGQNV